MAGCVGGGGGGGGQGGQQTIANNLVVFSWYEQWHQRMLNKFKQQHSGLSTSLTAYGSNQELYSKLKAAGTDSVDFVLPSNNMLTRLREEDMIQPINTDWIDRWNLQKPLADKDPWKNFVKADGEYWGVPFAQGIYMNAARKSKVEQGVVPKELITSWDLYFEDTDARLGIKDYGRRNVSIVIWHLRGAKGDINKDPGDAVSWSKIEDKLVEMIRNSKTIFSSAESARRLIKQDQLDAANIWGGDVVQLRNMSGVEDAKGYFPEEGTNGWFDSFAVPKGAPHAYTAHQYMNFILKPERLLKEYEIEGEVAVQKGLLEKMSTEKKQKFQFLLDIPMEKLQPYTANKKLQNRATQAWNNAKSRA
ncbi:MAG: PotD/PotF family extracellular solute-binding protein [Halodesulfurarchaeum sp.]